MTTLAIVSGVASYDLPADFLFVVELPGAQLRPTMSCCQTVELN